MSTSTKARIVCARENVLVDSNKWLATHNNDVCNQRCRVSCAAYRYRWRPTSWCIACCFRYHNSQIEQCKAASSLQAINQANIAIELVITYNAHIKVENCKGIVKRADYVYGKFAVALLLPFDCMVALRRSSRCIVVLLHCSMVS
jgi:hypothetical protein